MGNGSGSGVAFELLGMSLTPSVTGAAGRPGAKTRQGTGSPGRVLGVAVRLRQRQSRWGHRSPLSSLKKGPRPSGSGGQTGGAGVEPVLVQAPRRSDRSWKTTWALAPLWCLWPRPLGTGHPRGGPWARHADQTRLRSDRAPFVFKSGLISVQLQVRVHDQCFLAQKIIP